MKRDPGTPSHLFANAALTLGVLSLLPPLAPLWVVLGVAAALLAGALSARSPERYAGRPKIWAGVALCGLGAILFIGESALFLHWKVRQQYEQRVEVSTLRMAEVSQALERYRQEQGAYPDLKGIAAAKALLEPNYVHDCPVTDGFGGPLSVTSKPDGFALSCQPPPRPGSPHFPAPLVLRGSFLPAPPAPPVQEAAPDQGPEGAAPESPPTEGGDAAPPAAPGQRAVPSPTDPAHEAPPAAAPPTSTAPAAPQVPPAAAR
ncbi:MAG: hypothetical protein ACP5VF_00535 [Acidobacteriota bacterium]